MLAPAREVGQVLLVWPRSLNDNTASELKTENRKLKTIPPAPAREVGQVLLVWAKTPDDKTASELKTEN